MDYKKVIEDYRTGEIDREKWTLFMDNDGGYWQSNDGTSSDDMDKKYGTPSGYQDIVDVLNAAGVKTEWC